MKVHPQRGGVQTPRTGPRLPARGIHLWDTRFLRLSEHEGSADGSQPASRVPCHTPLPLKTQKAENRGFWGPWRSTCWSRTADQQSQFSGDLWRDLLCFRIPGLLVVIQGKPGPSLPLLPSQLLQDNSHMFQGFKMLPLNIHFKFQSWYFPNNWKQSENSSDDCPTFGVTAQSIGIQVVSVCTRAVLPPSCCVFLAEMFAASVLQQTHVRDGPIF